MELEPLPDHTLLAPRIFEDLQEWLAALMLHPHFLPHQNESVSLLILGTPTNRQRSGDTRFAAFFLVHLQRRPRAVNSFFVQCLPG
jgi:hypothetical protein